MGSDQVSPVSDEVLQSLQSKKLEAIGRLAAGIAHEINTPLQYVGDNLQFLSRAAHLVVELEDYLSEMACDPDLSEDAADQLHVIMQKAKLDQLKQRMPRAVESALEGVSVMTGIVGAMKSFAHPGGLEKSPTDVNASISTTLTVCRHEWLTVAEVRTDLDPDLPYILALPGELNQAFLNLMVNAAHAIEDRQHREGGGTGLISITTQMAGENVEIRIQDDGEGIPDEAQSRVFEPFFTTKEVGRGSGQGLAIARSVIVDKHGGTLDFETNAGRGTTFVVRLPLKASRTGKEAA